MERRELEETRHHFSLEVMSAALFVGRKHPKY
jgi:hypothetical protein